jgi:hypothetical protein
MMTQKWLEANPKDIVWDNIDDGPLESRTRFITSWLATFGLIVAWTIPVAFVGSLSNIAGLCQKFA